LGPAGTRLEERYADLPLLESFLPHPQPGNMHKMFCNLLRTAENSPLNRKPSFPINWCKRRARGNVQQDYKPFEYRPRGEKSNTEGDGGAPGVSRPRGTQEEGFPRAPNFTPTGVGGKRREGKKNN